MESLTCVKGLPHDVVGWHMDENDASKDPEELLFGDLHCLFELHVLGLGGRSVPLGVHAGDARTKICSDVVPHGFCLTHTVVESIDLKDEFLVDLLVHFFQLGLLKRDSPVVQHSVRYDLPAEVLEHEPRTAQLGDIVGRVGPRLLKRLLVVIKPVSFRIVDATHIHNYIKLVKYRVITCANNDCIGELARLKKHDSGQNLIAMERI